MFLRLDVRYFQYGERDFKEDGSDIREFWFNEKLEFGYISLSPFAPPL